VTSWISSATRQLADNDPVTVQEDRTKYHRVAVRITAGPVHVTMDSPADLRALAAQITAKAAWLETRQQQERDAAARAAASFTASVPR
jgi:predicted metal-dependent hydrolase